MARGLIIRQTDVGESGRIIDILTKEHGKISAFVPGVKAVKSRRLSSCSVFCYSKFSLSERGGKYTVTQSEIMESFYNISNDIQKTALGYYICELVGFAALEGEDCSEILTLTLNTLYAMRESRAPNNLIKSAFELRILSVLGYMPDLRGCICGENRPPFYFIPRMGSMVCSRCKKQNEAICLPLIPSVLQAMRYITGCDERRLFSFTLSHEGLFALSGITEAYTITQMEHSFKTLEFYKSIT